MFATERDTTVAHVQYRSGQQGTKVERDTRRTWTHGEGERVCLLYRDPLEIVRGLYGWEI